MTLDSTKNFAIGTVNQGYDESATSIILNTGDGVKFPSPDTDGAFNLVWWNYTDYKSPADDPNVEIVRVTDRISDTLSITRAQEDTTASTKNTSGKIYKIILGPTSKTITDINTALNSKLNNTILVATGSVDGNNNVFEFISKPIFIIADGVKYRENKGWAWSVPTLQATLDIYPQYDIWGEN